MKAQCRLFECVRQLFGKVILVDRYIDTRNIYILYMG